jgi:glycine cleavage system H lipoate-binding protein
MTGEALIGLDDFAHKVIGEPNDLDLPEIGSRLARGDPLFTVRHGEKSLTFGSPVSGVVSRVNHELMYRLDILHIKPYDQGWICAVNPSQLGSDLRAMLLGAESVTWYESEIAKYHGALHELGGDREPREISDEAADTAEGQMEVHWSTFGATFLRAGIGIHEELVRSAK